MWHVFRAQDAQRIRRFLQMVRRQLGALPFPLLSPRSSSSPTLVCSLPTPCPQVSCTDQLAQTGAEKAEGTQSSAMGLREVAGGCGRTAWT